MVAPWLFLQSFEVNLAHAITQKCYMCATPSNGSRFVGPKLHIVVIKKDGYFNLATQKGGMIAFPKLLLGLGLNHDSQTFHPMQKLARRCQPCPPFSSNKAIDLIN